MVGRMCFLDGGWDCWSTDAWYPLPFFPPALWEKPFIPFLTTPHNFCVDEDTTVKVPTMLQDTQHHWYLHDRYLPCLVLWTDYQGNTATLFILPNQGKMEQVEEVLTPKMLTRWSNLLRKR